MKKVKFKKLVITNFRNINELTIDFKDDITEIIGENGLGKTNTLNAIMWCLFGKNIEDTKQFVISPIIDNVEDNSINTMVKLVLDNGYVIERSYKNRKTDLKTGWVIDDKENLVAITQTNYLKELSEQFVDEETFKSLSNINYIPNLHWKELKELIFTLIGDIKDDEVLIRDNFELIEEYVRRFGIEQTNKLLKETDNDLNENIKRLETQYQTLLNTKEKYVANAEENNMLIDKKRELENTLAHEEKAKEIYLTKQAEYMEIKSNINLLNNQVNNYNSRKSFVIKSIEDYEKLYKDNSQDIELLRKNDMAVVERRLNELNSYLELIDSDIINAKEKMQNNKSLGENLKAKEIKVENETCSVCGQHLPEKMIQQTLDKLKEEQLKELEILRNNYALAKDKVALSEDKKEKILNEQKELLKQLEEIKVKEYEVVNETDKQKQIRVKKEEYELELKGLDDNIDKTQKLIQEKQDMLDHFEMPYDVDLSSIRQQLSEINDKLATTITLSKLNDDVENVALELNNKKESKVKNKEKLQEVIRFNNLKADLLRERVKEYFKICQFKTKETTLSGDEVECFKIVTKDGVEYKETNTANKILMGIDLILGIQKAKEIYLPIIIDGVEVITKELVCNETQLIITRATAGVTKLGVK